MKPNKMISKIEAKYNALFHRKKEFVYAKAKIDEQIAAIVGPENFQRWETRYGN